MITQSKATYSSDELAMMLTAYMEAVEDLPLADLVEACRRWPRTPERGKWWPAVEELRALADDIACEHRMRALPRAGKPKAESHKPDRIVIHDPAYMRRVIADMRANPGRYIAAEHFAAIGEMMLARWADQQSMREPA